MMKMACDVMMMVMACQMMMMRVLDPSAARQTRHDYDVDEIGVDVEDGLPFDDDDDE